MISKRKKNQKRKGCGNMENSEGSFPHSHTTSNNNKPLIKLDLP
jgi:hypothetical protein